MDDDKDCDATDPKLISSYTRSEALADGVLVDVTETARESWVSHPGRPDARGLGPVRGLEPRR